MAIFEVLEQQEREAKEAMKRQEAEIERAQKTELRKWLIERINQDLAPFGGADFWDMIAEYDPGIGTIELRYQGVISWQILGHKQSGTITVFIPPKEYTCRSSRDVGSFWTEIGAALKAEHEAYKKALANSLDRLWKNLDYHSWNLDDLRVAQIHLERAKEAYRAVHGKVPGKDLITIDQQLALAEAKLGDLIAKKAKIRHAEEIEAERLRRQEESETVWLTVRRERLSIALFYPFVYYRVFYGTSEESYINSKHADPIEGDWYDDLYSQGEWTKIPTVIKIERMVVDCVEQCKYISWCRRKTSIGVIYTAPDPDRGFTKAQVKQSPYPQVQVNIANGELDHGEKVGSFLPVPLEPGTYHVPWTWLESQHGLISDLRSFALEMGYFMPVTLQEWAAIINGSYHRDKFSEFCNLCGFDESQAQMPPKMERD